jgi:Tn3 transposase DDE domain
VRRDEAVYILDGLIKNTSDIQPDMVHGDTHAQSAPVFALAHLLGINLMPAWCSVRPTGAGAARNRVAVPSKHRLGADRAAFPRHAARRHLDLGRPHDAVGPSRRRVCCDDWERTD